MSRIFPSKILLFGEYSVISGSGALSVPFERFFGKWSWKGAQPDELLEVFIPWLQKKVADGAIKSLDLEGIMADVHKGLTFDSNIPVGYGLGSSGAFSAALYNRYTDQPQKQREEEIDLIREELAAIESFFHGQSSGMDPLVSLLNKAVLVNTAGNYQTVKIDRPFASKGLSCYLLNSKKSRRTAPYVKLYKEKMESDAFREKVEGVLLSLVDRLIEQCLNGQSGMEEDLYQLSGWQLENLGEMIPPSIQAAWRFGLDKRKFAIKLCGAGGGGFFLGFCKEENEGQLRRSGATFDPIRLEL